MRDKITKILRGLSLLFALVFLSVATVGCGYSTGSLLPSRLKTIYVDNFKNRIDIGQEVTESSRYTLYRPGLENDVTNAVINRFVFDGNLKIAKKENADLMLKGDLVEYRQEALRYDAADNVEEYRIKIAVNIELVDMAANESSWEEVGYIGEKTYKTTGRFVVSEDVAREEAIEDLARRIVERTVENW